MPIKNIITEQPVTKEKLQRAKELRREMTPAEKLLWQEVRAKKLGVRFRRQQIIQGFIVDFYCHKAGLVVEVDGDIYDLQQEEDARREEVLSELGLRTCAEPVEALSALGMMRSLKVCPRWCGEDQSHFKLKEPGLQVRLFQFLAKGGEEKSPYDCNFSTSLHNMLDASPTSCKRLQNVFYEPFLSSMFYIFCGENMN